MNDVPAYGHWSLVIINSLIFIIFAFLYQAQDLSRLAIPWWICGIYSCVIYRNVRISSDHLPALRVAFKPLPQGLIYTLTIPGISGASFWAPQGTLISI
jgi:hypothetical protein